MLAGVDEAGRGPVLGPLVVAAVLVDDERALRALEVKDSKLLSPARREALAEGIRGVAKGISLRVIEAEELNRRMPSENLNEIEVVAFAEVLDALRPGRAVLDACDPDATRFGARVGGRLRSPCPVVSEHEADARHPVVAAASILAKVERDARMAALREVHGPCGSGYAGDETTRAWLAAYVAEHRRLPPIARAHWETSRRLLPRDRTLAEFGGPSRKLDKSGPGSPRG